MFETRPFWLSLPRTNFTTASVTPVYRTQSKDTERPTHLFPFLQGEASPVTAPPGSELFTSNLFLVLIRTGFLFILHFSKKRSRTYANSSSLVA